MALKCGVLGAAPTPDYVWFSDNTTIDTTTNTDKIRTLDDGATLVIYNLLASDTAPLYSCGVTNARMFDTEVSTRLYRLVVVGEYMYIHVHIIGIMTYAMCVHVIHGTCVYTCSDTHVHCIHEQTVSTIICFIDCTLYYLTELHIHAVQCTVLLLHYTCTYYLTHFIFESLLHVHYFLIVWVKCASPCSIS